MSRKILFMGTPEFAAYILKDLIKENYNIVGVVTQPDKKFGRKQQIRYSEVKEVALENNIKVYQPVKIREEYEELMKLDVDIIVTAAYGQIIPEELLNFPKFQAVNVHGSLLPKYRGGAPIHYAILNGDEKTGVSIMRMVKKMDAGDIITQDSFEIKFTDNLENVYNNMKECGSKLLLKTLPLIFENKHTQTKQDEELVSYAYNISREDELIDFALPAIDVYNKVRAFNPFPVAFFRYKEKNFKVYSCEIIQTNEASAGQVISNHKELIIKCGENAIKLIEFKPEGKKKVLVKDYLNGNNIFELDTKI